MAIKGDLHIEAKGEDPSSKIFLCLVLLVNLSGALVILPWMGSSYPHFYTFVQAKLVRIFLFIFRCEASTICCRTVKEEGTRSMAIELLTVSFMGTQ